MANKRLTQLPTLSAAKITPDADLLHIIDDSAAVSGKNKKITVKGLLEGSGGTDPLPYRYKDTFTVHNADVHTNDNRNSHTAPHIWTSPTHAGAFYSVVRIRCWAGGGGGGGGNDQGFNGGGGGGGAYTEYLYTYQPGESMNVYVGIGGFGGPGNNSNEDGDNGKDGSDTKVTTVDGLLIHVVVDGGKGGTGAVRNTNSAGGAGGSASAGVNGAQVDGAAGLDAMTGSTPGGAGGGSYVGGRGGRGGSGTDAGNARAGNFPGAGGGGGSSNSGSDPRLSTGGSGAHGLVTFEYNNQPDTYTFNVHSI